MLNYQRLIWDNHWNANVGHTRTGNQTWQENPRTKWWIFQPTMFDYCRYTTQNEPTSMLLWSQCCVLYMYIYRLHYISHGSCLHWGPFPTWGYSVTWIFWVWASQKVGIPQWCWISHGDFQFPEGHPCSDRTYIDNSQDAGAHQVLSPLHIG